MWLIDKTLQSDPQVSYVLWKVKYLFRLRSVKHASLIGKRIHSAKQQVWCFHSASSALCVWNTLATERCQCWFMKIQSYKILWSDTSVCCIWIEEEDLDSYSSFKMIKSPYSQMIHIVCSVWNSSLTSTNDTWVCNIAVEGGSTQVSEAESSGSTVFHLCRKLFRSVLRGPCSTIYYVILISDNWVILMSDTLFWNVHYLVSAAAIRLWDPG